MWQNLQIWLLKWHQMELARINFDSEPQKYNVSLVTASNFPICAFLMLSWSIPQIIFMICWSQLELENLLMNCVYMTHWFLFPQDIRFERVFQFHFAVGVQLEVYNVLPLSVPCFWNVCNQKFFTDLTDSCPAMHTDIYCAFLISLISLNFPPYKCNSTLFHLFNVVNLRWQKLAIFRKEHQLSHLFCLILVSEDLLSWIGDCCQAELCCMCICLLHIGTLNISIFQWKYQFDIT